VGYKRGAVDAFLERIAADLNAGRVPVQAVTDVKFPEALKGYHRDDVDEFLNRLVASWRGAAGPVSADSLTAVGSEIAAAGRTGPTTGPTATKVATKEAPEPSLRRTLKAVLITVTVLGLVGYGIGSFLSDQLANAALVRNGVVIQARVVAHSHIDSGDSGSYTNLAGHPVGSFIGVRYDPENPGDARPMVDNNDVWLQDAFYLGLYVFLIWIFVAWAVPANRAWRRRRESVSGDGGPGGGSRTAAPTPVAER
jgi:DivIVA domain-containing protein